MKTAGGANSILYEVDEYSQMDEATDEEENAEHQVNTVLVLVLNTVPILAKMPVTALVSTRVLHHFDVNDEADPELVIRRADSGHGPIQVIPLQATLPAQQVILSCVPSSPPPEGMA